MDRKRKNLKVGMAVPLFVFLLIIGTRFAYAESCNHTNPPYPHSHPPPTWSYSDSFVSLFGETQRCWSGEQFKHKGHTYGAQYPGNPLSQIRVQVWDWEELWGSAQHYNCPDPNSEYANSGWKYGVFDVWINTPYRQWTCSGGGGLFHYYAAWTSHDFGPSNTQSTGAH